jgi:CRP/FNR family transcriptional regulator
MLRIMSREIDNEQWLITLLGKSAADARVAAFLCNLSSRFAARGYSATRFVLGMPRHDIANYLGLAVETVCRVITRFQKQDILTANGKQIHIHNLKQLYEITGTLRMPDLAD